MLLQVSNSITCIVYNRIYLAREIETRTSRTACIHYSRLSPEYQTHAYIRVRTRLAEYVRVFSVPVYAIIHVQTVNIHIPRNTLARLKYSGLLGLIYSLSGRIQRVYVTPAYHRSVELGRIYGIVFF